MKTRRQRALLYPDELPAAADSRGPRPDTARSTPESLSRIEMEFCLRWCAYYEPARAAMEAGYAPARAHLTARRLLSDPRIKRQVALIEQDRLRRLKFDGDEFLAREIMLATAPATELIEVWVPPCRYCWGRNNEYQRTHSEFMEDFECWMRQPDKHRRGTPHAAELSLGSVLVYNEAGGKMPFDERGGDGYDPSQPPNPACPNCHGRGNEDPEKGTRPYVRIKDSRELSEAGKMLFAGVKSGRSFEQLMHSQEAARQRLMGMLGKFLELRAGGSGEPGRLLEMGVDSSIAGLLTADPRDLSDADLDAFLSSHGVVIEDATTEGGEAAAGPGDSREDPADGGSA